MAAASGKNNTVKLAIAIGALVIGIALPLYYFFGTNSTPAVEPGAVPNQEQFQQQQEQQRQLRQQAPQPVEEAGA